MNILNESPGRDRTRNLGPNNLAILRPAYMIAELAEHVLYIDSSSSQAAVPLTFSGSCLECAGIATRQNLRVKTRYMSVRVALDPRWDGVLQQPFRPDHVGLNCAAV